MAIIAGARRAGVGGLLLSSLMQAAKNRGDKEVLLSAQTQVQGFYLHFGFRTIGEEYIEAKIKHINMKYSFE
jgi:predicted GNAT family N-acyltransferase